MKCEQKVCQSEATCQFQWPGYALIPACESCKQQAIRTARVMGFVLHVESLTEPRSAPEVMREDAVKREMVNHPQHYGGDTTYEHWKVMVAWGLVQNAFLYNCTKYICRVGKKGNPLEDLKKARWYLDRAIAAITEEELADATTQEATDQPRR